MKRLHFKLTPLGDFYKTDVERIVAVCADRGYHITSRDAMAAWEKYSDELCAGWLILPRDDADVFEEVRSRCYEIDD